MAYSRFRHPYLDDGDMGPYLPAFNDEDGVPLYEAPYQDLLADILTNNDVASLHLYNDSPNTRVFWEEYETYYYHPLVHAARSGSFDVLKALLEIYLADSTLTEPIDQYLVRNQSSPINDACAAANREVMLWLLHHDPPLGTLHDRSVHGETPLFSAAKALGQIHYKGSLGTVASGHENRDQIARLEDFICFLLDMGCSVPNSDVYVHAHGTKKPSHLDQPRAEVFKTVLGAAIPYASYQMVNRLIAEGADVHSRQRWQGNDGPGYTNNGVTVLHIAALFWNVEGMKALADHLGEAGLEEMASIADDDGRLPLHWALMGCEDGRTEMVDWDDQEEITARITRTVQVLLKGNPDTPSVRDKEGATAFHYAMTTCSNLVGILPVVKILLDSKPLPSIFSTRNHFGRTVLETAMSVYGRAMSGRPSSQFLELLLAFLKNGADGRTCNNKSQNLLHHLAMLFHNTGCADIAIIEKLLEYVNINDTDVNGFTPLHFMVWHPSRVNAVRYLISRGANVNMFDNKGNSPLHEAMYAQLKPVRNGRRQGFLSDHSKAPHEEMIKVLVDAGASMYHSNAAGETPQQLLNELIENGTAKSAEHRAETR